MPPFVPAVTTQSGIAISSYRHRVRSSPVTNLRTLATERPFALPRPQAAESAHAPDKFPGIIFCPSLSAQDRDLLQPHLKQLQLPQGTALYRADDIISNVYFPHSGIMSMIVGVSSGQYVEAGMLGRNGVIGTGAALGRS